MEIVSDYEIKDQQVLQKVKNLYLRQDMVSLVSASTGGTEATPLICALHRLAFRI
jgi:hypothetical protein